MEPAYRLAGCVNIKITSLSNGSCEHLSIPSRKIGRPDEGGLNTLASCESADVRDPFLGLRLGCGSGLGRKLKHYGFLMLKQVS